MEVFLKPGRSGGFRGFHPWVLEGSIVQPTTGVEAGQVVELVTTSGNWIGRGIFNPHSRIRIRMYQWQLDAELDDGWFVQQLEKASQLRTDWMQRHENLNAVRWINSEGDGLSGLVVDQFDEFIVIQVNAAAILRWESTLIDWLKERFQPAGVFLRMDPGTAKAEGMLVRDEIVLGQSPSGPVSINDGGLRIQFDLQSGQKTGYYLDQRANRYRAASWMGTGPMLDVCCYLGGFSLAAGRMARPEKITAVDSSMSVLRQAEVNSSINEIEVDWVQADCFDYLSHLVQTGSLFETVVLDPPRMAGHRSQIQNALRAYYRLNLHAVNLVKPGGLLVTCSCSGRIGRNEFVGLLGSVAQRARRTIQIIESLGADFDHPVSAQCPEGDYLKCLICRVY
jgi:23S rRNA (cytosine1962-C5)-methyltransferase